MNRRKALMEAATVLGAYSKTAFLASSAHVNDAESFAPLSRRLAVKWANDIKQTVDAYGEAFTELEVMYEKDVDSKTFIEACSLFMIVVGGRLDELNQVMKPYNKLSGFAKLNRLKGMIKEK